MSALPAKDEACDRFLSTYVFDLLGEEEMSAALREAHRVLRPGGLLCVASLAWSPPSGRTRFRIAVRDLGLRASAWPILAAFVRRRTGGENLLTA